MAQNDIACGTVQTAEEPGRQASAHHKQRCLTLETLSGLGDLSTCFLSEFERGRESAEIGEVLKALRTLGLGVIPPRQNSCHCFL